jgi:2-isopropylmalate synthase
MLKHQSTYEIMRPETVGAAQTRLVLGKHSGRAALAARLAELGSPVVGDALDRVFVRFKALADHRKQVTDADLDVLLGDELPAVTDELSLEGLQVSCGTMGMPTATVRLIRPGGAVCVHASLGTGPVDATYKAIDAIVGDVAGIAGELVEYAVHAVTEGIDALGHVYVRVREVAPGGGITSHSDAPRPRMFHGAGADTDIIVASAKAYLRALNRMFAARVIGQAGQVAQAQAAQAAMMSNRDPRPADRVS